MVERLDVGEAEADQIREMQRARTGDVAERVAAAGGTLAAGPEGLDGWRVEAALPIAAVTREEAA